MPSLMGVGERTQEEGLKGLQSRPLRAPEMDPPGFYSRSGPYTQEKLPGVESKLSWVETIVMKKR